MAALLAAVCTAALEGQGFRGWTGTSLQYIELRPLGVDTIPRADVLTDADGRFIYEGQEVSCVLADECTGFLARPEDRAATLTQDLGGTAWGLGVRGLSVTTLLRARARFGSGLIWPRSDDEIDALLAYAELDRGPFTLRGGRQEVRSGLGFPAFDGVSATYRRGRHRVEVYGGRSLARGLREPSREVLRSLDDFFVDKGVVLFGVSASGSALNSVATLRYHREITSDRSSLVSDRASFDASTGLEQVRIRGSIDYDFSFQRVGKGRITATRPFQDGRWLVEVSGRRYVPYFDLSTIWGFFEPVSYEEVLGRVGWTPLKGLGVSVSAGRRWYGDSGTPVVLRPLSDSGWRVDTSARWSVADDWAIGAAHQLEWGPGAFLNSFDGSVRYQASENLGVSVAVVSFQQIEEYRVGDGRALGGSLAADYRLSSRMSALGGASLLSHRDGGSVFTSPWNQSRLWTSLRVELGEDPGIQVLGADR